MKIKTIMIRPSGNGCNLSCVYCYSSCSNKNILLLSIPDFKNIFMLSEKEGNDYYDIYFHGGEPLLWGYKNFKIAFSWLHKNIKNYKIKIQTNATLINKDFLDLFKKYNVYVSLSLDGPKYLNDSLRRFPINKFVFNKVISVSKKLNKQQRRVGCVIVITKMHLNKENEIYNFFKINHLGFQPSPLIDFGRAKDKNKLKLSLNDYSKFMINLFDIWFEDSDPLDIPYFVNVITGIIYNTHISQCKYSNNCVKSKRFICLDSNGNLSICNRTIENSEFIFGNIRNISSLDQLYKTKNYKKLINRSLNINKKCFNCNLYNLKLCKGNSCPFMSSLTGNLNNISKNCKEEEIIITYIYNKVKKYVPELRKRSHT